MSCFFFFLIIDVVFIIILIVCRLYVSLDLLLSFTIILWTSAEKELTSFSPSFFFLFHSDLVFRGGLGNSIVSVLLISFKLRKSFYQASSLVLQLIFLRFHPFVSWLDFAVVLWHFMFFCTSICVTLYKCWHSFKN